MNLLISLMALAGWVSWGYIVVFLDPEAPLAPLAFYSTLFVALTCTLAQMLRGPRKEASSPSSPSAPCLGHAAAITTIVLFALWLQSLRMLTPLNGILMIATFLLIEIGFHLSGRQQPRARRRPRRQPVSGAAATGEK